MYAAIVRRLRCSWIMVLVAVSLTSVSMSFALPATTADAASLLRGPGFQVGDKWVGPYDVANVAVYCLDPAKSPAAPKNSVVTGSVAGATAIQVAQLNYVLDVYGTQTNPGRPQAHNNAYGAAVKLATWSLTGNKKLADQIKVKLPATVQNLLKTMLSNAAAYYGPYKIVHVLTKPTLGKAGTDTIKLVSIPTGRALPNQILILVAANAKLAATTVSTGATGVVKVSFTKTAWPDVKITATSKYALPSTKIRLWNPPYATYQRFLSAAPGAKVSGFATYHATATNLVQGYACGPNCKGIVPVTFTNSVTNTYGGTARFVMLDNGVALPDYLQLAPGASGNKVWMMADKHSAQIELQVLVNGVWVKTLLANRIVVDCPPVPAPSIGVICNCVNANLSLSVPAGTHAQRVIINGVVTEGPAGQAITASTVFNRDQAHTFSMQTAVQRTNGVWITSDPMTLALPAIAN